MYIQMCSENGIVRLYDASVLSTMHANVLSHRKTTRWSSGILPYVHGNTIAEAITSIYSGLMAWHLRENTENFWGPDEPVGSILF